MGSLSKNDIKQNKIIFKRVRHTRAWLYQHLITNWNISWNHRSCILGTICKTHTFLCFLLYAGIHMIFQSELAHTNKKLFFVFSLIHIFTYHHQNNVFVATNSVRSILPTQADGSPNIKPIIYYCIFPGYYSHTDSGLSRHINLW